MSFLLICLICKIYSCWVVFSSLTKRFFFSLSYCILFCHVWLLSLGGLLFSNWDGGGGELGEWAFRSGEEWTARKLWPGCILFEMNLFLIKNQKMKNSNKVTYWHSGSGFKETALWRFKNVEDERGKNCIYSPVHPLQQEITLALIDVITQRSRLVDDIFRF